MKTKNTSITPSPSVRECLLLLALHLQAFRPKRRSRLVVERGTATADLTRTNPHSLTP